MKLIIIHSFLLLIVINKKINYKFVCHIYYMNLHFANEVIIEQELLYT